LLVEGVEWRVHYAFFARAGFTDAARDAGEAVGAQLVDLATLDRDLGGRRRKVGASVGRWLT
jgi:hypothetical protein